MGRGGKNEAKTEECKHVREEIQEIEEGANQKGTEGTSEKLL